MTVVQADRVEIESGERPLREVNREIRAAVARGAEAVVTAPLSRHSLAVGLRGPGTVRFRGNVGYYCGGLSADARIRVEGDAGWAVGEALAAGLIQVDGYAGMSCGASMRGGVIHVRGDAGPRAGIAIKGGDLVVEGDAGYSTGFMAHAGRIIVCGDTPQSVGDSLWAGSVWVAGTIGSLGVDAKVVEPAEDARREVEALLAELGVVGGDRDWKQVVSAERLWYFEAREARNWLMI